MSNKISWCDITINPITGCVKGCSWCYARDFAKRLAGRHGYPADHPFKPTFHFDKLAELTGLKGCGKRVFLDSMGDWFSPGVEREWVWAVIEAVRHLPNHTFLVLTKWPERMTEVLGEMIGPMPANLWFGVSVTCQKDACRIDCLRGGAWSHNFISFEPLLGPIDVDLWGIEWAIIGAETGNRKGRIALKRSWLEGICDQANSKRIPVFLKQGLCGPQIDGSYCGREEFPEEML